MSEERFISEPIDPVAGTADVSSMARGEPGLPRQFTWRGRTYAVAAVVQAWKRSEPERHKPGNERYLRRHYWTVETTDGQQMTLYCLRSAKPGKHRWFLYTVHRS
jgi:hypothetical protein